MRGTDERVGSPSSYVDLKSQIPPKHPLRAIRAIVNEARASETPPKRFDCDPPPIGAPYCGHAKSSPRVPRHHRSNFGDSRGIFTSPFGFEPDGVSAGRNRSRGKAG